MSDYKKVVVVIVDGNEDQTLAFGTSQQAATVTWIIQHQVHFAVWFMLQVLIFTPIAVVMGRAITHSAVLLIGMEEKPAEERLCTIHSIKYYIT